MQTPCRIFLQGVAKFALLKAWNAPPRPLVARRMTIHSRSRCVGVRDGSGNRAAGADANTLQDFPAGCCEIRLAARWSEWRDSNSRPYGPEPYALPNCATPRKSYSILFPHIPSSGTTLYCATPRKAIQFYFRTSLHRGRCLTALHPERNYLFVMAELPSGDRAELRCAPKGC